MKHYIDITLLSDEDISLGFVWQKLYKQIHILLAENKVAEHDSAIGVSFPKYGDKAFPLGDKLRLFAETEKELIDLELDKWLVRVSDYIHIKSIKPVPSDVSEFVCFKRKQFKSPAKMRKDIDKRAKSIADKNNLKFSDVKEKLLSSIDKMEDDYTLPFINLESLSSSNSDKPSDAKRFKLFLELSKSKPPVKNNFFTCYGLSRRSTDEQMTVPWF